MLFHRAHAGPPDPPLQSRSWPPLTLPRAAPACQLQDSLAAGTHTCTRHGNTPWVRHRVRSHCCRRLYFNVASGCNHQLAAHKPLSLCNRTGRPTPADLQVSTVGTISACMGCCCLKVKGGTTVSQREKQGADLQGTTQPHPCGNCPQSGFSEHDFMSRHSCLASRLLVPAYLIGTCCPAQNTHW